MTTIRHFGTLGAMTFCFVTLASVSSSDAAEDQRRREDRARAFFETHFFRAQFEANKVKDAEERRREKEAREKREAFAAAVRRDRAREAQKADASTQSPSGHVKGWSGDPLDGVTFHPRLTFIPAFGADADLGRFHSYGIAIANVGDGYMLPGLMVAVRDAERGRSVHLSLLFAKSLGPGFPIALPVFAESIGLTWWRVDVPMFASPALGAARYFGPEMVCNLYGVRLSFGVGRRYGSGGHTPNQKWHTSLSIGIGL